MKFHENKDQKEPYRDQKVRANIVIVKIKSYDKDNYQRIGFWAQIEDLFLRFDWIKDSDCFDVLRDGYQTLTIPVTAEYKIEIVAPGNSLYKHPGVIINGTFKLKKGQKITVALGQKGSWHVCGSGGSFVVLDGDGGLEPLLVAGGAGRAEFDEEFGRGNLNQTAVRNERIGKNGIQVFIEGDEKDVSVAGAGYSEAPQVSKLAKGCVPPKSYRNGLTGGYGVNEYGTEYEGGFGGGGGCYRRIVNGEMKYYFGAGGGFTGGSTKVDNDGWCDGGGGGSFSADPSATFDHDYVEYGSCKININL